MINNDTPSMDNIYNSKFYSETKAYEQNLSDDFYKKAQMPFETGVIPHYFTGDSMNTSVIKSLSGNDINMNDFKHGNMQHFIRKGVTQNVEQFGLSKNMGYSSDTKSIRKTEVETSAFFQNKPYYNDPNIDKTNFLASRTNLSQLQNNISPIQSILVGPGLNKGYTSEGTGGFQQAETANYIKPKSKEELRPLSNQKSSIYTLPMKPKNNVEQRGIIMPMNKNKADRSFNQTEDNWFKGQSTIKKEVNRPEENLKDTTARTNSHINYYGPLKNQDEYINKDDDYGKNNIIIYDNERNLTQIETPVANFSSVIKAIISPITDVLKITMKEYFVDNPRLNGNATPQSPEKATLYDPVTHTMKTTIKETTIHEGNNGNLTGADETYTALYDIAKTTTKETTIHEGNGGFIEGKQSGYVNSSRARTTLKETLPCGGTVRNINNTSYYSTYVYDPSLIAKKTVKETTVGLGGSGYGFIGGFLNSLLGGYLIKDEKAKNTQRQNSLTDSYGIAGSKTIFTPTDREADYNAEIDGTRELIMMKAGRTPNAGGKFVGVPKEDINMVVNKRQIDLEESERIGNMGLAYEGLPAPIDKENITKEKYQTNAYNNRLDSSILSSLIDNDNIIKINPIRTDCDN